MKIMNIVASILLVGFVALAPVASAHVSEEMLQCPIFSGLRPLKTPKLLQEQMAQSGLVGEVYDVTGDGMADIAIYSPTLGGFDLDGSLLHKDEPIFYEVDLDGDAHPDVIFINTYGLNTCDSIEFYKYIDMVPVKQGLVNWQQVRPDLEYDGRALEELR